MTLTHRSPPNCLVVSNRECTLAPISATTLTRRSTIARSLANDPEVLLLDEPTGDLDTKNTVEIMDLLLNINQTQRTTCIMVTHNPDVECYADRILYVEDGRFKRQALNYSQTRLVYEQYIKFLNSIEGGHGEN